MEEQVDGVRDWGDLLDALEIGEEVDFGIRTGADMLKDVQKATVIVDK